MLDVNSPLVIKFVGVNLKESKFAFLKAAGKSYSCCPVKVIWVPSVCSQGHSTSAIYKSLIALLIKFLVDVCTPLLEVKLELVSSTSFNSFKTKLVNCKYVLVVAIMLLILV